MKIAPITQLPKTIGKYALGLTMSLAAIANTACTDKSNEVSYEHNKELDARVHPRHIVNNYHGEIEDKHNAKINKYYMTQGTYGATMDIQRSHLIYHSLNIVYPAIDKLEWNSPEYREANHIAYRVYPKILKDYEKASQEQDAHFLYSGLKPPTASECLNYIDRVVLNSDITPKEYVGYQKDVEKYRKKLGGNTVQKLAEFVAYKQFLRDSLFVRNALRKTGLLENEEIERLFDETTCVKTNPRLK